LRLSILAMVRWGKVVDDIILFAVLAAAATALWAGVSTFHHFAERYLHLRSPGCVAHKRRFYNLFFPFPS
jgi:hypothetical protein